MVFFSFKKYTFSKYTESKLCKIFSDANEYKNNIFIVRKKN
jgi:hypothetical protein